MSIISPTETVAETSMGGAGGANSALVKEISPSANRVCPSSWL
jgi:hypothetical protein